MHIIYIIQYTYMRTYIDTYINITSTFSSGHYAYVLDIIIVRRLACTYFWETVPTMAIKKKANAPCGCIRKANFLSLTRSTSVLMKYECHLKCHTDGNVTPNHLQTNIQKGPNSRFSIKRWWWVFTIRKLN